MSNRIARSSEERRKVDLGPPAGIERRLSVADRRKENNEEYVSFRVAGQLLGIAVGRVQEILPEQPVTRVPRSAGAVAGLLNLRGQIVTVIDLRRRLALPERGSGEAGMHVIVTGGGELFSLLVDAVGDVIAVARSRFAPAPATLDECWRSACLGVCSLPEGLLVVADVEALVRIRTDIGNNRT